MSNSLEAELSRATVLTFEGLAFMFPSPELLEEQLAAPFEEAVAVEFNGTFGGCLVLVVAGGILSAIVNNMLGAEKGASRTAQHDALGELANVICGNVLTRIAGPDKSFLLNAPREISRTDLAELRAREQTEVRFGLDGGRAEVALYLNCVAPATDGAARS